MGIEDKSSGGFFVVCYNSYDVVLEEIAFVFVFSATLID